MSIHSWNLPQMNEKNVNTLTGIPLKVELMILELIQVKVK